MKKKEVLRICETAILVAMAVAVDWITKLIPFLNMPSGGHISLSPLVLVILCFREGRKYGLIGCFAYALVNWLLDGITMNPLSILLDYIIGFGVFAIAGFYKNVFQNRRWWVLGYCLILCSFFRFWASTISGILAYSTSFRDSMIYNFGYIFASCIASIIIGYLIFKPLCKVNDMYNNDNKIENTIDNK